jgi:hypothetical protein
MHPIDLTPSTTGTYELIHRNEEPTGKNEFCNRAGIRMHDTAASTAARPIQAHF